MLDTMALVDETDQKLIDLSKSKQVVPVHSFLYIFSASRMICENTVVFSVFKIPF